MNIHNKYNFILVLIITLILSLIGTLSYAQETDNYDSLIVQPKQGHLTTKRMSRLMFRSGFLRYQKINNNLYVVPLNKTDNKKAKIEELKNSGLFKLVEPDYKFSLDEETQRRNYIKITKESILNDVTPNDKGFSSQYYLREINATKAWRVTVGNSLLVGILDTGVDSNHPDLTGKILGGDSDLDLQDDIGHGTEVAGIIAANTNNNQGIAGIAWNTKILSIRITDEYGQARVSTVVAALDEAYNKGVKIVQISLSTNQFSQALKNTIKQAQDRGILIVSTGGNTGVEELRYPAAFDGVIGVGAVNEAKQRESYSTTGEHVSLVAPGSYIYTTSPSSNYSEVSGTSFSAPQAAGTAALVWSIAPNLTNEEVREILIQSASDLGEVGKDKEYGYGLLNTEAAVELAKARIEQAETEKQNANNLEIKSWIKR